jgi:hypothetical protein
MPATPKRLSAQAGVPESSMLDMMGHVSMAILGRYSHIVAQARGDVALRVSESANETSAMTH